MTVNTEHDLRENGWEIDEARGIVKFYGQKITLNETRKPSILSRGLVGVFIDALQYRYLNSVSPISSRNTLVEAPIDRLSVHDYVELPIRDRRGHAFAYNISHVKVEDGSGGYERYALPENVNSAEFLDLIKAIKEKSINKQSLPSSFPSQG